MVNKLCNDIMVGTLCGVIAEEVAEVLAELKGQHGWMVIKCGPSEDMISLCQELIDKGGTGRDLWALMQQISPDPLAEDYP